MRLANGWQIPDDHLFFRLKFLGDRRNLKSGNDDRFGLNDP
jgi:hypothetical protein